MVNAKLLKLPTAAHQHWHEHHQIVIGVRGEAELSVDGAGAYLDTWRAYLVPTEARHDYRGNDKNHVLVINLDPLAPAVNSPAHADYERMMRVLKSREPCKWIVACTVLSSSPPASLIARPIM